MGQAIRAKGAVAGVLDRRAGGDERVGQLQGELGAIWQRLEQLYPDVNRGRALAVRTELESRIGLIR